MKRKTPSPGKSTLSPQKHGTLGIALILTLLPLLSNAQSIHQIEYEAHRGLIKQASLFAGTEYRIAPIRQEKNSTLTHAVFGYLPDWEYINARNFLRYNLLTHISVFDFTASTNGEISTPSYWPWVDVINAAHEQGVKIIVTVVNFTSSQIHTLITNSSSRQKLFENLVKLLQDYDLQGVNIDFENVSSSDRGNLLNSFMAALTEYLHRMAPGSEVSFAAPPVNWGGWNFAGLAHACDYIFIMGYNFYGSWSTTSGPTAPLRGGSYNITNTIDNQYAEVVNAEPEKIILGVPYYGDRWQTRTSSPYSTAVDHLEHPRYKTAYEEALTYGLKWDLRSQTSWYSYKVNHNFFQVWFETDSSLGLKYDLVLQHELKGTGMWALGYDRDRTELWNELQLKFANSTGIQNNNPLPDENLTVYPNPVSNYLNISYSGVSISTQNVTILDMQARLISDFRLQISNCQNLKRVINISNLLPGLYYIRVNNIVKKFIKQ